jgi:Cobalamin biosynthesis protein CobN and related Mg-chelatases
MLNPKWFEAQLAQGTRGRATSPATWRRRSAGRRRRGACRWVYDDITKTFVLDDAMRERLAAANPNAASGLTQRLLEAHDRGYWQPSAEMLAALRDASDELEDRLEGVHAVA